MASNVKPIPEGVAALFPMLICRHPEAQVEFCKTAFGAVEGVRRPGKDGKLAHAALTINRAMLIIQGEFSEVASRAPKPDASSPVVIYVYVENVDQVVERAVAAGAKVLIPIKDQFWGDRTARIMDPSGHVWTVSTRKEETTEPQRAQRWEKMRTGG
jgi:PhnB protein